MDDSMFGHNGLYGDAWKAEPLTYYYQRRYDTGEESDVYMNALLNIELITITITYISIILQLHFIPYFVCQSQLLGL